MLKVMQLLQGELEDAIQAWHRLDDLANCAESQERELLYRALLEHLTNEGFEAPVPFNRRSPALSRLLYVIKSCFDVQGKAGRFNNTLKQKLHLTSEGPDRGPWTNASPYKGDALKQLRDGEPH